VRLPDRKLPELPAGDIIAVLDTGEYEFAVSSQHNSRPRCPEVLITETKAALMRRGETISDLTATMQCPPWQ
jgi:diaminopimelate decarboxylase